MEMAQALKPLGVRPITGAEITLDDGSPPYAALSDRTGYTNLCRVITAAHWPTRRWAREGLGEPVAQVYRGDAACAGPARRRAERHARGRESATPRGWSACRLRARRRGGRAGRARRAPGAAAVARRLLAAFGPDRFRIELQRPYWRHESASRKLLAELAERLGCRRRHRQRRALPRGARAHPVAGRHGRGTPGRHARRDRAASSRQLVACAGAAGADGPALPRTPDAVAESARLAELLPSFDLTEDSATATPARRTPTPTASWPSCAALASRSAGPRGGDAAARLEEELRVIRHLRLSGFFLLHRDMLELAREVALEVRGPESARGCCRPGAARLERLLDRLLPHRPLAHRPDPERVLPGALPQRGADRAARHRPRLPARHPRRADPARARPLRARPLCVGGRLLHFRGPQRGARLQGARPAAGRDRAASAGGRPLEGAQRHRGRPARSRSPLAALGRAGEVARDAWGLPRHQSQHPAAW